MRNRIYALAVSAALSVMLGACSTVTDPRPASDTSPSRSNSSWCQGDGPIRYRQADEAGQDDPGNTMDSDPTVEAIQAHNDRYRAACPSADREPSP